MSVWVRGNVFMLMVLKKSMLMSHLWSSEWRNETNINKSSFSNSHTANLSGVFLYTPSGYRKPFLTGWEWRGWRLKPVVCVNREWASLRCFSPHCDSCHASLMNTIRHCMLTLGWCVCVCERDPSTWAQSHGNDTQGKQNSRLKQLSLWLQQFPQLSPAVSEPWRSLTDLQQGEEPLFLLNWSISVCLKSIR